MAVFKAPVDDYLFLLHDVLEIETLPFPGFAELTREATQAILEGSGSFCAEVLFPLNGVGDIEGATLIDGRVRTPKGFPEAYRAYCEGGWNRAAVAEELGGLGLPKVLTHCLDEMNSAANAAFHMYSGFASSVTVLLSSFGPAWMQAQITPRIVAGDWTATMSLTEAGCGTDLRLMKTRAVDNGDGAYRINGTKIFISGADNDFTENVVHLVLAKLPDSAGNYRDDLSTVHLFLAPAQRVDPETGAVIGPNGVSVSSIEHKMGLKGNATCVLNFDDAIGWRLTPRDNPDGGAPGMAGMFYMMNHARLGTSVGSLGLAATAYHSAQAYAKERLAGRAPGKRRNPDGPADPIVAQPDVRRLLLDSAAFIEGARATIAWGSLLQSVALHAEDPAERQQAEDLVSLFTPIFKAFFTDLSNEACNACLQVFGGHGYIRETGVEQLVRDNRISQIYEGANGVQAFDLVARRMTANNGRSVEALFGLIDEFLAAQAHEPEMRPFLDGLSAAYQDLREALRWLDEEGRETPEGLGAAAYDVLTLFGIVIVALSWARIAGVCLRKLAEGSRDEAFLRRKLILARVWMERRTPLTHALLARLRLGPKTLMALDDALI